ncbi:MAG: Ig-like domain-containing protein, partial [Eubacterium sp.]|nr:Ig-like domain-containing protein [Eubacterium sp.]
EDNPNYAVRTFSGIYTVGNSPHYYGTQGDERFTCTVCGAVDDDLKAQAEAADKAAAEAKATREKAKAEFIASIDGTSTESSVTVKWGKVPNAKRYAIYAAYCDKNHKYKYRKIKTVSGKVTKYEIKKLYGKKLNPKKNVKVYIVAQKKKNGKWKRIFKTPTFHIAGAQSKCSNVKKITVKKAKYSLEIGKTAKIKAEIVLVDKSKKAVNHVRKLRFKSTNTSVVKVTKSGKIKAVGKGKATVFVYSNNGTAKAIKVTVK